MRKKVLLAILICILVIISATGCDLFEYSTSVTASTQEKTAITDIPGAQFISSVYIYEGKVYSAGLDANGYCCYWKGTVKTVLSTNYYSYSGQLIFVEKGVVYVAAQNNFGSRCYWTNGIQTTISDCADLTSLFVYDGIVYTCGKDFSNCPCYWIGTKKTLLASTHSSSAEPKSICVIGGVVYIAGIDNNENGDSSACYWKGGTEFFLNNTSTWGNTYAAAITVYKGTVYIAGEDEQNSPCFWKGTSKTVINKNQYSYAKSIFVVNGDVYTICNTGNCYWVNTTEHDVVNIDNLRAMFVTEMGTLCIGATGYTNGYGTPSIYTDGVLLPL